MLAELAARWQLICHLTLFGVLPQASTLPSKSAPTPGAMSGVVLDGTTRAPVAGAIVSLWGAPSGSAVSTDSKGRFVFRALPPSDRYELMVTKPGFSAGGLA